eukprot:jgi/Galph1/3617/GphlegSOOS_G2265.1
MSVHWNKQKFTGDLMASITCPFYRSQHGKKGAKRSRNNLGIIFNQYSSESSAFDRLSNIAVNDLVRRERFVLESFFNALEKLPFRSEKDTKLLLEVIKRLDGLFLLVVVGEYNSGKSSLINALLGGPYLPKDQHQRRLNYETNYNCYSVDVPWLKHINVVDTPGTNAIEQAHEILTREFVPRADLILFTTSADRPFSESERRFLQEIRDWGKKIIIVLNKIDLLMPQAVGTSNDHVQTVVNYVKDHARMLVGSDPHIFPVSARMALQAKQQLESLDANSKQLETAKQWLESSRFPLLEAFITDKLDDRERLKIKLETPLSLAQSLLKTYQKYVKNRKDILTKDMQCIQDIQESIHLYRQDFISELHLQLSRIDNIIIRLQQRANQFFYDRVQLRYGLQLLRNNKMLSPEFESALGNTSEEIEQEINAIVGWLLEKNRKHWKEISRLYEHRLSMRRREFDMLLAINSSGGRQSTISYLEDLQMDTAETEYLKDSDDLSERNLTFSELKRVSMQVLEQKFSSEQEAQKLVEHVRKSLWTIASAEMGALGLLGTLSILSTLDITGIMFTSTFALASTAVFPYRKKQFLRTFQAKVDQFRSTLRGQVETELFHQLEKHISSIENGMAPFSRFIRSRMTNVQEEEKQLNYIASEVSNMRELVLTSISTTTAIGNKEEEGIISTDGMKQTSNDDGKSTTQI